MASILSAQTAGGTAESNGGSQSHLNNTHNHLNSISNHSLYNNGSTFHNQLNTIVDPNSWDYYDRQQVHHHQQLQQLDPNRNQQQQQQEQQQQQQQAQSGDAITRPWEIDPPKESIKAFEPFPKLPSFQSQFHGYSDSNSLIPEQGVPHPVPVALSPSGGATPTGNNGLTQLTPIATPGLTTIATPNFHTLTAVNTRPYPLVPAPIQARDIPNINQQYIDERHIQLYQPITSFPTQNVLTVIKKEHFEMNDGNHSVMQQQHPHFNNQMMDTFHTATSSTSAGIKIEKVSPTTRVDGRKKDRRKIRANSLESSAESESSAMDVDPSNPGQVDAVSSTANFKSPLSSMGMGDSNDATGEKQTKKKRKRCGECIGCQRKDNCGDCAPCRNDKSHQICKQRRCEKLTDKKLVYGADGQLVRTESRRGRGKGRGGGTTRGRKPAALGRGNAKLKHLQNAVSPRQPQLKTSNSPAPATVVPHPSPNTTSAANTNALGLNVTSLTAQQQQHQQQHQQQIHQVVPSPQQHIQQQQQQQQVHQPQTQQITAQIHTMKDQPQQPMAPMAFYPTWQADPSQGWQNQFIQQIPQNTPAITSLNSLEFQPQSYTYQPNGYVQTGIGFDPNYARTYAAPVQRYEFQTQQIAAPINQVSLQSVSFAPAVTYAGQVSTAPSAPVVLSNSQQHHVQVSAEMNKTMSGNDTPGYPRVNSVPPRSLNCNGYSGDFSGSQPSQQQPQNATNSSNAQQQQQQAQQPSPMHPPLAQNPQQVPQSPNRSLMTQSQQQQQQQQQQQTPQHVSQSPNHIPQSPSNHNMQQYSIPPSPNLSQQQQLMHNPHQGMHTPNQQQQQQNHASSPSHAQMNQDWNWNNQAQQQQQPQQPQLPGVQTDMFNQADRVNINTRIKSMILRKNDPKDMPGADGQMQPQTLAGQGSAVAPGQTQNQTGHFLSYSHHLRSDSLNASGPNTPSPHQQPQAAASQPGSVHSEPIGGGGEQIWKPQGSSYKKPSGGFQSPEHQLQQQPPQKSTKFSNKNKEKNINDPGGGVSPVNNGTPTPASPQQEIKGEKGSYSPMPNYTNLDANNPCYPSNPHGQYPLIKQEPGLMPQQNNKMEGYERNYQNFIQYADYYQNEVQGPPGNHPQQQQQDYHQQQQNYHQNSSYYSSGYQQNYQHNFAPSYQHPAVPNANSSSSTSSYSNCPPNPDEQAPHMHPQPPPSSRKSKSRSHNNHHSSDVSRKADPSIIPLPMNYEKEIPAHAYPIPPNRYPPHLDAKPPHLPGEGEHIHDDRATGYPFLGEGGPVAIRDVVGYSCCRQGGTRVPTMEHIKDGSCPGMQTKDEILDDDEEELDANGEPNPKKKDDEETEATVEEIKVKRETINPMYDTTDRLEKGNKAEVPDCDCFSSDKNPPEPGSYYTHLGAAATLAELRKEFEDRCGISGRQLRIEKILYTGKEGKTTQGCPVAKWIIRRADPEEKILVVVKKRQGHKCHAAFIVIAMVAWDGMPRMDADNAYGQLIGKLNKYGLPTTRRCATNENRTCACQGLDPETSGASYSFGCSWSMYYNGCKYARSKTVRKFRLSVKNEETEIEDHMNVLATILSPIFKQLTPRSYDNQTKYEKEAQECRLGLKPGKPFSGVTACLDFCAHAHRDLHNMQDGCTVQVALLKPSNRDGRPPDDEQFHVLPLYTMDTTDEFESAEGQLEKNRTGAVQILEKFPREVRVRSTPLQPCRRHGKKRKDEECAEGTTPPAVAQPPPQPPAPNPPPSKKESSKSKAKSKAAQLQQQQQQTHPPSATSAPPSTTSPRCQTPVTNNPSPAGSAFSTPPVNHPGANNNLMSSNSSLMNMATMIDTFTDAQLQSNQISSTVLDSPYSYDYQTGSYIDNRNYYGNWPPPPQASPAHPALQHPPLTPQAAAPNAIHTQGPPPPTPIQHHDGFGNFGNHMPATNLTQLHDVRLDVKSRGSEENPDSTTIVSHIGEHKLAPPPATTNIPPPEEGFVKPKPPPDYQYTQYPNYNQMYPPPTYSHYDAYNNMNYNYGYHQPYAPYSMYPQQTPPPTPPPPSPNWNMYPPSTSSQHPLPPPPHTMHHQQPQYTPTALPPVPQSQPMQTNQQQASQQQPQPLHQQSQQQHHHQQHALPPQLTPPPQTPTQQLPQSKSQQPPAHTALPPPQTDPNGIIKPEPIGEVTEINDNLEAFQDPQMGGVAIALNHGSVLIECAKHEMHATTALKRPNRTHPTRMTLIFYQHRNLNRTRHGIDEWEEKMRVKKINTEADAKAKEESGETVKIKKEPLDPDDDLKHDSNSTKSGSSETEPKKKKCSESKAKKNSNSTNPPKNEKVALRAPTLTTTSWTTLFPMHPCVVTGPYQEGSSSPTSTTAATPE